MPFKIMNSREFKIFITFFLFFLFFIHWTGWRENSSFDLTKSIVDNRTLNIDEYYNDTSDRAYVNGHYYVEKNPGISFLAVPVYAVWEYIHNFFGIQRGCHGEFNTTFGSENKKITEPINLDVLTSVSMVLLCMMSAFFGALLVILIYKMLRYFTKNESHRLIITILAGIGTLILPYSTVFQIEIFAAFFAFLSFFIIFKVKNSRIKSKYMILAGLSSGIALLIAYTAIMVTFALIFYILISYRKKEPMLYFLLGFSACLFLLLLYNYAITEDPLRLPIQFTDKTLWNPDVEIQKKLDINEWLFGTNPYVILRLLIYPEKGLFFFYPALVLSITGLIWMWRSYKKETITIGLLFIALLYFMSVYHYWVGGYTYGPHYLIYVIPFLMLPLSYSLRKIPKIIWLLLMMITITLSILCLTQWNDLLDYSVGDIKTDFKENLSSFEVLYNPIFDLHIQKFLDYGPRSRLIEGVISGNMDIRELQPPIADKTLFSTPLGFLVLNFRFLPFLLLSFIFLIVWWNDIKSFSESHRQIILLVPLIFGLSLIGITGIAYSSGFYHEERYNNMTFRWMSDNVTLAVYNPNSNDESIRMNLILSSLNRTRGLDIYFNDRYLDNYEISPYWMYISTPVIELKPGENKLSFISKCEVPAVSGFWQRDIRCLSLLLFNVTIEKNINGKLFHGKGWYPKETYNNFSFWWVGDNATMLVYNPDMERTARFEFLIGSLNKKRELELYLNNDLIGTYTINSVWYGNSVLTKDIKLKAGENTLMLYSKDGCENPTTLGLWNDMRCLSFIIHRERVFIR
ncbi:MAG: phospholipid carrier-dependent glycosyltransferase [Candidatus Aenigmatarchaeota archaeon]